jgi:hypothetical protein
MFYKDSHVKAMDLMHCGENLVLVGEYYQEACRLGL